jgi:hypothetical protein
MLLHPKIKHVGKTLDREGKFPLLVHKILAYDQSHLLPTHEPIAAYMKFNKNWSVAYTGCGTTHAPEETGLCQQL